MTKTIEINLIGTIKTPHQSIENMPIQAVGAKGIEGVIELYPEYAQGLTDLEGFSHLILVYYFHKLKEHQLMVKPFMDNIKHGIFATRSPKRPARIGMSTVKLIRIEGNKVFFNGADMLNQTPLIDIKPFFRQADNRPDAVCGWLDAKEDNLVEKMVSDDRFKDE